MENKRNVTVALKKFSFVGRRSIRCMSTLSLAHFTYHLYSFAYTINIYSVFTIYQALFCVYSCEWNQMWALSHEFHSSVREMSKKFKSLNQIIK